MESLLQDLRNALRALRRQRGLTLIGILSLGLGIGATSTVFTWLQGFVINPLPVVPAVDRLVIANTRAPDGEPWSVSWPDFKDWRALGATMDLAAWDMTQVGLREESGTTERAWGTLVAGNYFDALGIEGAQGRLLTMADEEAAAPVAVLGHSFWRRRFAGDSAVLGRTVLLNGAPFIIVGIAPARFTGTSIGLDFQFYLPITVWPLLNRDAATTLTSRTERTFEVVGRLRPAVTTAQAAAELDRLARQVGEAGGLAEPLGAIVRPFHTVGATGAMRPVLLALLALAALVLLIACANVASLLLARAIARRREVAVRLALGAGRTRLIRQLLTESLLLAGFAGVLGLYLSYWGRDAFMALLPTVPFPVGLEFPVDGSVILFASLVTTAAAVSFGLVPALQATRPALVPALKDEIGQGTGRRARLQSALVVAQVALSLVTLVAAGLFLRSLDGYRSMDTGMHGTDRVLLVSTDLRLTGMVGDSLQVSLVERLLERVRALPGVEAAAVARAVVLGPGPLSTSAMTVDGYTPAPNESMQVSQNVVSGDYFRTTGIAVRDGRDFGPADLAGAAPVAIVNEAFVDRYLAGRVALGARIDISGTGPVTIVGVVATSKYDDYTESPKPVVFRPYAPGSAPPGFSVHVRTVGDPLALTSAVRGAFIEAGAALPFLDPRVMAEYNTLPYFPQRVGAIMLAAIGGLALLLAAIGIYGVMAYTVSRRTREIGVRIALGAAPGDVVGLILGRAASLIGLGLLLGGTAALGVGQLLQSQLYGVSPRDPVTFGGIFLLLSLVGLGATWWPARRAARVDPVVALRQS